MSQASSTQLKLIDTRAPIVRVFLLLPVLLALIGGWFATRWYIGNTMAEFASAEEDGGVEATRRALRLAPSDPIAYLNAATVENSTFDSAHLAEAVRLYEQAVRLSPGDYRMWVALGRAREQAGDIAGGEKALRRAMDLAPSYAYPRWHLGNLLLRGDRSEEAFTLLRQAADSHPTAFRGQIFEAAWRVYDKDLAAIERAVGSGAATRAQLAAFLAGRDQAADAVRLWTSLSPAEKKEQRKTGENLLTALVEKKQYRAALDLARDLGMDSADAIGQFTNPGFENPIAGPGTMIFGWQIAPVYQAEVSLDSGQRHSGNRSLRITFNGFSKPNYYNISQLIVVDPNTRYRFEAYVRTQDLKSGGTPLFEVANVSDGKILGASTPFSLGRNDWQPFTIEFLTPDKSDAIYVRTNRAFCGDVCPIFGTIWYDDFNLQRLGPGSGSGQSGNETGSSSAGTAAAR